MALDTAQHEGCVLFRVAKILCRHGAIKFVIDHSRLTTLPGRALTQLTPDLGVARSAGEGSESIAPGTAAPAIPAQASRKGEAEG